jgi:hypothetical protein
MWHEKEPEGWFGLGPAEQKIKLEELAGYLYELILLFEKDGEITGSEAYQLMKRLFSEQCECAPEDPLKIRVKTKTEGATLQSPYDPDASCGHKGPGYSAHITETCNNAKTEIITDYEVHGAARSDIGKALSVIERLDAAGCKPDTLFADGGYPSVPSALKVKEQNIDFITPVNRARLSQEVIGRDRFHFDAEGLLTACPMGHKPIDHRILSAHNTTDRSLHAIFDGNTCRSCTMLDQCPVRAPNHRAKGCQPRQTTGDFRLEITAELRLRDDMYALQQTTEWKEKYRIRAGIEATNSELKRAHGMGRLRLRRLVKVCFVVACKIIACNIKRWAKAWGTSKRTVEGSISSVCSCVKLLVLCLIGLVLLKKQIFARIGRFTDLMASERAVSSQGSLNNYHKQAHQG